MPPRLVLIHTGDVHGRVDALGGVAALVERTRREEPDAAVVWVDAGDVEDQTHRLSNVTKGTAMLRLLEAAGCAAAAVGNASAIRYGPQVLAEQGAAVRMPLLCTNLRTGEGDLYPGTRDAVLLDLGAARLGLVGITATRWDDGGALYGVFGATEVTDVADEVRGLAGKLRADGADAVVLLSHLGLEQDRALAPQLGGAVDAILGGHSHDVLPEGEVVAGTPLLHTGAHGAYAGRVELAGGRASVRLLAVDSRLEPPPSLAAEAARIEREVEAYLAEVVGELAAPLEWASDRECGAGSFMADVLRERMDADVGIAAAGSAFNEGLPAGRISRGTLYDACPGAGNPGVATMTGSRLRALVARGLDPAVAAEKPWALRGMPNGLLHLSGAEVRDGRLLVAGRPLVDDALVRVAGTDWELDTHGPYADPSWRLEIAYDVPTIQREAVEEHLARVGRIEPPEPRLHGRLAD